MVHVFLNINAVTTPKMKTKPPTNLVIPPPAAFSDITANTSLKRESIESLLRLRQKSLRKNVAGPLDFTAWDDGFEGRERLNLRLMWEWWRRVRKENLAMNLPKIDVGAFEALNRNRNPPWALARNENLHGRRTLVSGNCIQCSNLVSGMFSFLWSQEFELRIFNWCRINMKKRLDRSHTTELLYKTMSVLFYTFNRTHCGRK